MNKIKVDIKNEVNGRTFGAIFDSQLEADDWIAQQQAKESWGENEKVVVKDEKVAPNDRAIFLEEELVQSVIKEDDDFLPVLDDESGEILYYEKARFAYRIPCEYVVTVEEYIDSSANRNLRDKILKSTDWLFVSDVPVPTNYRTYYKNYRAMIRSYDLNVVASIESFENWMKRTAPEQFLDGGEAESIIKKFNYYL